MTSDNLNFFCHRDSNEGLKSKLINTYFFVNTKDIGNSEYLTSQWTLWWCQFGLWYFCVKYLNNIIIGHINITSVRNKFDMFSFLIADKLYVSMVSETKIDSSFPTNQFSIHEY